MNVVFHVSEPSRFDMTLANIPSFLHQAQVEGVQVEVELVINGDAITEAVEGSKVDLEKLVDLGVVVAACHNSMVGHDINEEALQPGLVVVPAGVYELARLQSEGYAYIKP